MMDATLKVMRKLGAPPAFSNEVLDILAETPPLPPKAAVVEPSFTRAIKDKTGKKMPQAIAHRGYKAKFPENTMVAFKGAVAAGTHALETDVHISKDGVVVLSHDATLQRCFGIDQKIKDCEWKYLSEVRTVMEPHEGLPRLEDLFRYLAQPGLEKIWLLLDIKLNNDPQAIMQLMAATLAKVPAPPGTRWEDRIILGCWAARYIPAAISYFPNFPITNIGFNIQYSRQFLAIEHMSFNMLLASLVSRAGRNLIRNAKADGHAIYAWTVNEDKGMDWCIRQKLDGVVTDDPRKYLDYCEKFELESPTPPWPWALLKMFVVINVFGWVFTIVYSMGHGFGLEKKWFPRKAR